MPVIYGSTPTPGMQPCSRTYRRLLTQAIQSKQYDTVETLFQQSHRLIWRLDPQRQLYIHRLNDTFTMNPGDYVRVSHLKGPDITVELLDQQCASGKVRASAFLGPQLGSVRRAMNQMQQVQKSSYLQAEQNQYPINAYKGLALYAPSPFVQTQVNGVWRPDNPQHTAGQSSGKCDEKTQCQAGLECASGTCVVPKNQRQCPPFQYPLTLKDEQGNFTVDNPSATRTQKVSRYSGYYNQTYDTCVPEASGSVQRWITPMRLRKYLGLSFDVIQLPVDDWTRQSHNQEILRDPVTYAPYFMRDENGEWKRVYKLNSAYSPTVVAPAASAPPRANRRRPRPPTPFAGPPSSPLPPPSSSSSVASVSPSPEDAMQAILNSDSDDQKEEPASGEDDAPPAKRR